jgi:hypothetical protein
MGGGNEEDHKSYEEDIYFNLHTDFCIPGGSCTHEIVGVLAASVHLAS